MKRIHFFLSALTACALFSHPARGAIILSTFDGEAANDNWSEATNWDPDGIPSNNATDQYEVTLLGCRSPIRSCWTQITRSTAWMSDRGQP
ncbi:MAG: hypothetical protein R3F11_15085 [Verrucomicrobiales bacterium]